MDEHERQAERDEIQELLDEGPEFVIEADDGSEIRFRVAAGGSHCALETPNGWVVMPFPVVATMAKECVVQRMGVWKH